MGSLSILYHNNLSVWNRVVFFCWYGMDTTELWFTTLWVTLSVLKMLLARCQGSAAKLESIMLWFAGPYQIHVALGEWI